MSETNTPAETDFSRAKTSELSPENKKLLDGAWSLATPNGSSPYLAVKGVGAFGTASTQAGALFVPMRDSNGELKNLQRLEAPDANGATKGPPDSFFIKDVPLDGLHHIIGQIEPGKPIVFSADYAEAAAIYQSSGLPVVVTFRDENTPAVVGQFIDKSTQTNSKLVLHIKQVERGAGAQDPFADLSATPNVGILVAGGAQKIEGFEGFTGKSLAELMKQFGAKAVKSLVDEVATRPIAAPSIAEPQPAPAQAEPGTIEKVKGDDLQMASDVDDKFLKLKSQYLLAENKFYFRDNSKTLAFEDTGQKVTTDHETPEVIRSMMELSKAKGWSKVKLNGTDTFKRRAWVEAELLGLKTTGYKPDDFDRNELAQRRASAEADAGPRNTVANVESPFVQATQAEQPQSQDPSGGEAGELAARYGTRLANDLKKALARKGYAPDSADVNDALDYAAGLATSPRVFVGKLIDHGPAPYEFKEKATANYFVKMETPYGEKTVWGVDIPRALAETKGAVISKGDEILLAFQGSKAVTVTNELTGEVVHTHRNTWYADKVTELPTIARSAVEKPVYSTVQTGGKPQHALDSKQQMLASVLQNKGAPQGAINQAIKAVNSAIRTAPAPTSFKPSV